MTKVTTGKCLCGAVSYTAAGSPVVVARCHCEECRRTSGAGHSTGAMFPVSKVTLSGEVAQYRYTSASGSEVTKGFCPKCSSPIFGTNTKTPDHMTFTLGTMDKSDEFKIQVVVFERDKPHWDQVDANVMSFDTQPDWAPPS